MSYAVTMYEDGRYIVVRVKARGEQAAIRKAEHLCPDAVTMQTERVR